MNANSPTKHRWTGSGTKPSHTLQVDDALNPKPYTLNLKQTLKQGAYGTNPTSSNTDDI